MKRNIKNGLSKKSEKLLMIIYLKVANFYIKIIRK